MKHAVEQYHRGGGIQKQSIRPSFGKRNKIAKALNCSRGINLLWSGFCLWESLQLFFWNITHSCNSVFISYNPTTLTYKWLPRPPPFYPQLACWTQYWLHSSKEIIRQDSVLQTSVMYRGLKRCFWGFRRETEEGRSGIRTFVVKRSHTHTQFSHMDTDIHMHSPIYMHSLGFSHAKLSVHHKVKQ